MNFLQVKKYYDLIKVEVKFTHSLLHKTFEKQLKTIEDQGIKQVEAWKALKSEENREDIKLIEGIFTKDMRTNEIKNGIYEIKEWEEKIKWKHL